MYGNMIYYNKYIRTYIYNNNTISILHAYCQLVMYIRSSVWFPMLPKLILLINSLTQLLMLTQ